MATEISAREKLRWGIALSYIPVTVLNTAILVSEKLNMVKVPNEKIFAVGGLICCLGQIVSVINLVSAPLFEKNT